MPAWISATSADTMGDGAPGAPVAGVINGFAEATDAPPWSIEWGAVGTPLVDGPGGITTGAPGLVPAGAGGVTTVGAGVTAGAAAGGEGAGAGAPPPPPGAKAGGNVGYRPVPSCP